MVYYSRMPKKTKKQKIIAAYRKKLKLLQTNIPQPLPSTPTIEIRTTQPSGQPKEKEILPETKSSNFFITDFKKSLLLSFAIIALEIIFYYARIYNYLKLN